MKHLKIKQLSKVLERQNRKREERKAQTDIPSKRKGLAMTGAK